MIAKLEFLEIKLCRRIRKVVVLEVLSEDFKKMVQLSKSFLSGLLAIKASVLHPNQLGKAPAMICGVICESGVISWSCSGVFCDKPAERAQMPERER